MGSIYTNNQGATYAALFCTFNVNGQADLAQCYLKDILGRTVDSFSVRSFMGGAAPAVQCADSTDNDGDGLGDLADPGCANASDNDETNAPTSGITLTARDYKVKGLHQLDLAWTGAAGSSVDLYRNGVRIVTTANDGLHTDATGQKGTGVTYTYKVCEAGTTTCSGTVTVGF